MVTVADQDNTTGAPFGHAEVLDRMIHAGPATLTLQIELLSLSP
jgi:hypothetical protein